ncbi:MAG TPA: hypothetical protein VEJ16_08595 [Alphaproteobacteria bacterium]|nr:hypothetical protein [Alphaproteobacteria bacterium]
MISTREIIYALYGAYRLCRFDRSGMAFFNLTKAGFWRSFFSAVLVAPIRAIMTLIELQNTTVPIESSGVRIFLIEASTYLILVFAYPLATFYMCELLDRRQRYVGYIVAYNWAGVLLALLALPFAVLGADEFVPSEVASFAVIGVTALSLVILWYVARTALEISGIAATALVAIDFVLSIVIQEIAASRLAVT